MVFCIEAIAARTVIDSASRMNQKMATKKTKKRTKKSKPTRGAKIAKRVTAKKAVKKVAPNKALANQRLAPKGAAKKRTVTKAATRKIRGKSENVGLVGYDNAGFGATGGQSGDTQGLSGIADAESESVKELLEEGQSFEAEVVQGVENVPDADEGEVRTQEVPEDDVPDNYVGKEGQN
jgi:hypothetical protein